MILSIRETDHPNPTADLIRTPLSGRRRPRPRTEQKRLSETVVLIWTKGPGNIRNSNSKLFVG